MTQNLFQTDPYLQTLSVCASTRIVWVDHQGARPELANVKFSPAQVFSWVPGLKSTRFVPKPQTSSDGHIFILLIRLKMD